MKLHHLWKKMLISQFQLEAACSNCQQPKLNLRKGRRWRSRNRDTGQESNLKRHLKHFRWQLSRSEMVHPGYWAADRTMLFLINQTVPWNHGKRNIPNTYKQGVFRKKFQFPTRFRFSAWGMESKQSKKEDTMSGGRLLFMGRSPCRVKKDTTENSLSPRNIRNGMDEDPTQTLPATYLMLHALHLHFKWDLSL